MNTSKTGFKLISAVIIFPIAAFLASCTKESVVNYSDKQSVSSEAESDSYFEDAENLSATISVASNTDLGGRIAVLGGPFTCATISLSAGATLTQGTITVDFGTGCTFNNVTRKGIMMITYNGDRKTVGSSITVTFTTYSVNGIQLEGTRTVTVSEVTATYIKHEITLTNGKITWTDNTSATRDAHHFRVWDWAGTPLVTTDDKVSILAGGTASGTNRNGKTYTMQITQDIVFSGQCESQQKFFPVSGEKIISVDSKDITVNYGSGDCDNTITVTVNGQTATVTVVRG